MFQPLLPAAARACVIAPKKPVFQLLKSTPSVAAALTATLALSGVSALIDPSLCELPRGNGGARVTNKASYPRDAPGITSLVSPMNLLMTVVRSGVPCYAPLVEQYFHLMEERAAREEEGEIVDQIEFPDTTLATQEAKRRIVRDLSVQFVRKILCRFVRDRYPEQAAAKLLKDLPKSARRKAERAAWSSMSKLDRASAIGRTVWRGNVIPVASELIVQLTVVSVEAFRRRTRGETRVLRRWTRRSVQAVVRFVAVRGGTAACAGLVVLVQGGDPPRAAYWGTMAGFALGDYLANTYVSALTDPWVAQA